ncbi:MAG TPA: glycoside hydrolase family 38 C-terminal domain-containing protein [Lentisphaeria bacterium]|nr:glycoside hydrolase family 38 C-terminal domain-containing protein [Lentisphaeria bacterium]
MSATITVHLVFHAHLDPIWLWQWSAGLDEAIATCRSAADRLDNNPDIFFTQGEAWVYKQIQDCDPALFARIQQLVRAGRWEITGGWWTQPDCNAPDGDGFRQQIQLGKDYFQQHFGCFPDSGFCPDSFGHNASLPALMRAAGQKHYVMMRPQEHEMALPARLFRWRGDDGGPELTTFRIAQSYNLDQEIADPTKIAARLRACCSDLPAGVTHTLCFAGIGDHGGGPSEKAIAWLREHADAFPGMHLVFSTPSRFFAAIADAVPTLPVVTGELQYHAIGCYSVHRQGKLALREATQRLTQLDSVMPTLSDDQARSHRSHWQNVVFHQFHDTLGGTCLASAYKHVHNQLGAAEAWAEERIHYELRQRLTALPDDPCQRLIFFNASDRLFAGWAECEPWLAGKPWHFRVIDDHGQAVPTQAIPCEAVIGWRWLTRIAIKLQLAPGEIKALRLVPSTDEQQPATTAAGDNDTSAFPAPPWRMCNHSHSAALDLSQARCHFGGMDHLLPELALIDDGSDTWSHGIDRYADTPAALATWGAPELSFTGPLLTQIAQAGRIGNSDVIRTFRLHHDSDAMEMTIRVSWQEKRRVLKLVLPIAGNGDNRLDAICGGASKRPLDGREYPIQGWTAVPITPQQRLTVICPDVFALDATPQRLRFTLLRSPLMAHHAPHPGGTLDGVSSDRGEHHFRFRFNIDKASPNELWQELYSWLRPPFFADLTRGMPPA